MEGPSRPSRSASRRPPLVERQPRVNQQQVSTRSIETRPPPSPRVPHRKSAKADGNLSTRAKGTAAGQAIENKLVHAVTKEATRDSKRNSAASTASSTIYTNKGKRKTHVGPWQLGKTLGKGATGRVRLAKHCLTGQVAAVKIVSKKSAAMVQSASMARMDKDSGIPINAAGRRTMPFGIEREVVIMKLIEHPNVINLYDVWENRGELYLVLEYVQGGELFDYVSSNGALPEEEAVRLFRQIIAGLSHCHRYNICHRDLKPENILLDANRNVKLADFGMAALQPRDKWLNTSCGSPHYAAPEVILGHQYRGDKADIWSVGIILFAMLNGFLPFDGGDLPTTLRLVKKGEYFLPPTQSVEASDLIQRVLQKRPDKRISMDEIWTHPLIRKYERYHASLVPPGTLVGPPPPITTEMQVIRIAKRSDIDHEILRNLQTLWHGESQEQLIQRLINDEPNHEKLFYWALTKFREEQLENFDGECLQYSASDYHHVARPVRKNLKLNGTGRGISHTRRHSQFSIVSEDSGKRDSYYKNGATSASKTTQGSYDPYRSSKTPIVQHSGEGHTIVIRRHTDARSNSDASSLRQSALSRVQEDIPAVPPVPSEGSGRLVHQKRRSYSMTASRSSLASSRHTGGIRKSVSYKRNVSFHRRMPALTPSTKTPHNPRDGIICHGAISGSRPQTRSPDKSISETQSSPTLPTPPRHRPRKPASDLNIKKARAVSHNWKDETRKVSAELGKICEEAFNRSSLSSMSESRHGTVESPTTTISATEAHFHPTLRDRPLPATPVLQELLERRRRIIETWGDGDPAVLADMLAPLDCRIEAEMVWQKANEPRAASDPTHNAPKQRSARVVSDNTLKDLALYRGSTPLNSASRDCINDMTIRLVSPDPPSPLVCIEPLNVRKNKSIAINSLREPPPEKARSQYERGGYDPRLYAKRGLDTIEEDPASPKKRSSTSPVLGHKWSWIGKRSVQFADDSPPTPPRKDSPAKSFGSPTPIGQSVSASSSDMKIDKTADFGSTEGREIVEKKRKWFQKMFGKAKQKETIPILQDHEIVDDVSEDTESSGTAAEHLEERSVVGKGYQPATSADAAAAAYGPIELSQNWFAKMFHIKPATRIMCLSVSKMRARKELVKVLKNWHKYGLRDVVFERRAGGDVVRGRVDACNYLHIKPVNFHAHLYTVLEHGRKANLSIMKFTQEKGAASSFHRVCDTLVNIFTDKDMVVTDPVQRKGIEHSLKDAGL
ncbi:hypothetical protein DV736_g799, partial [Chaetothyriales sp. CBS 134916]